MRKYVCGHYLSSKITIKNMVTITIITLLLNHSPSPPPSSPSPSSSPTPNIHMQHHPHIHHRSPTLIRTLSLCHTHLILPILTLLLISLTPTHLFCTGTLPMVIFSGFDDLLWMHVYHVHAVMHIVMLKWCIRCYILFGLTWHATPVQKRARTLDDMHCSEGESE